MIVSELKFFEICRLKLKTMTIEEVQQEIIEEFSVYTDWMDKYSYLIELGNELKDLDPKEKIDQNIIKGCQSRVWLVAEMNNGKINFRGESDAVKVWLHCFYGLFRVGLPKNYSKTICILLTIWA